MRAKRAKHKGVKALIILFICLLAAAAIAFGVTVGVDRYEKSAYPLKYSEYVERFSSEYGLDKYMVYAFIVTESGFDPESVSYLGARGLMQIMPDTFEWIRYRLGEENDPEMIYDKMFEPKENIRYGCYLLSFLSEEFGGGLTELAAAYHAGAGSVSSWLENPQYSENGRLTDIPNADTAHYADKIQNAYNVYCRLYGAK